MKTLHSRNASTLAALIALFLIHGDPGVALAQAESPPLDSPPAQMPVNRQATAEALAAFKSGHNETAITKADECISRYRETADRIQHFLTTNQTILPKGKVSAHEKERIATYQILHDVATCLLIKGQAEEQLGHTEEARKAYAETKNYTHARVCDPDSGLFSSPAEAASERLAKLSPTPKP